MRTQNNLIQKLANLYHQAQSIKANFKYNFPYKDLKFIGVTGTDGKTTTTAMINHIMKQNELKVAYISTIKAEIGNQKIDTGLHVTTPDPWDVPKYLRMMADKGIEYAIIESTSQGLQQNRLWGIKYDAVTITNIKSDHLDYHKSWQNYAKAKFLAVKKLHTNGLAVLNADDLTSKDWLKEQLSENTDKEIIWYSKKDIKNYKYTIDGLKFEYKGVKFNIPLLGEYNLENSLAAINITNRYLRLPQIAKALASFQTPTGRMEVIQKQPFTAIIDFAHTPHALENALGALTPLKSNTDAKVIAVFGCAGKRDKRRREMGRVAAQQADLTILTAEDPRDEKLADINNDIVNYAQQFKGVLIKRIKDTHEYTELNLNELKNSIQLTIQTGQKPFIAFDEDTVKSRIEAIDLAVRLAEKNDIVFCTGKAHEESQCFGSKEYPWNEHRYLKRSLEKLTKGKSAKN
jgi:UDP-N-acetylmuramoyl-L-alanyl-D-glutamate--2,6-diaminopimelate ligase